MSFISPTMLFLLVLVPIFVLLYVRYQQRRQRQIASYGSLGFVKAAAARSMGIRRHIPPLIFLIAATILIVALARPQTVVSLPRIEGTVILDFDVSGSMAADDFKPTRMDAAKAAAQSFVENQPSTVQIGVVSFSDSGLSVQQPSNNEADILAAINRLTPERGTSLADGIYASLDAIASVNAPETNLYSNLTAEPTPTPTPVPKGTYTSGVIVLLSDGENTSRSNPLQAAQAAADRGVRIYTVGIGSAQGVNLTVNGFNVHTSLDEATMQQLAQMTGGTYYNAETEQDLMTVYNNLNPQLILKPQEMEVTALFAGAAMIVLLIGGALSLRWFGRAP